MDLHQVCCVVSLVGIVVHEYEKQDIFQHNDAPTLSNENQTKRPFYWEELPLVGWILNYKLEVG